MQVKMNGCPAELLPPYELEMVPTDWIFKESFQRGLREQAVLKALENLRGELLTPVALIKVGPRRYSNIDGGHRVDMARRKDRSHVFAMVFSPRSFEERAELFVDFKTKTTALSAIEEYNGAWQSGKDVRALDIREVVEVGAGIRIVNNSKQPGTTKAIGTLKKVYKQANGVPRDVLEKTMSTLLAVGAHEYGAIPADAIWAVGRMYGHYDGQVDPEILERVLRERGMGKVREVASELQPSKAVADNSPALGYALRLLYNKWAEHKLPTWQEEEEL